MVWDNEPEYFSFPRIHCQKIHCDLLCHTLSNTTHIAGALNWIFGSSSIWISFDFQQSSAVLLSTSFHIFTDKQFLNLKQPEAYY